MKKSISVAVFSIFVAVISVMPAFAENTFHIGAYAPYSHVNTDDSYQNDIDISEFGVGFEFDFTHVADSGFTVVPEMAIGYLGAKSDWIPSLADLRMEGGDYKLGVGLGGSFIHSEKTTFSWLGNLGYRIQCCAAKKKVEGSYEISSELFVFWWYIGTEFAFTHRFTEHLGMFFNVGFYCNAGITAYDVDDSISSTYDTSSQGIGAALTCEPRIGIAITL